MRRIHARGASFALCALTAALLTASPAQAQQAGIFDDLLLKLRDKGVLTEDEYETLKAARAEERTEQRVERRQQALKQAQAEEKEEKAKEESKSTLKGVSRNGLTWETGDKSTSISLTGRIQADYRNYSPSALGTANTFDVRRGYLGVTGRVFDDFTFEATYDIANDTAEYLWINWGRYQPANVRAGLFKMPMSLDELTSSRFIDFNERSIASQLAPSKEVGLSVGSPSYRGLSYALALSNGQGKNGDETNTQQDSPDVLGRITANVAEMLGHKDNVYHIGASYGSGKLASASQGGTGNLLSLRTEGRGYTMFTLPVSAFTGGPVERERGGFEAAVALGRVKVQGEYFMYGVSGTNTTGVNYDRDLDSYYLEALWLITGETYAQGYRNSVFGQITPNSNFTSKASGSGAWELGLRYSHYDAGEFFDGPTTAGTGRVTSTAFARGADAYTVGLKWIMTPMVRLTLNYVHTEFDTPVTVSGRPFTEEDAYTLRLGLHF